jgi:hypothetical protein
MPRRTPTNNNEGLLQELRNASSEKALAMARRPERTEEEKAASAKLFAEMRRRKRRPYWK